jgi:hypothetical protein
MRIQAEQKTTTPIIGYNFYNRRASVLNLAGRPFAIPVDTRETPGAWKKRSWAVWMSGRIRNE